MTGATYRYLAAVVALGGVAPVACEKESAGPPKKNDSVVEMAGKEPSRQARSPEGPAREDRGSRDPAHPAPPAEVAAGHQTPDSGGQAPPEGARHSVVKIAGQEYSLLFERDDLSVELQNTIVADINLIVSPLDSIAFMPVPQPQAEKYQKTITHWWPYKVRRDTGFPKVMRRYFGGAVKVDNEYKLVIHRKLIQAYEEALEFKKQHPAMFTKLDEFLALLQDREALEELAKDLRAVQDKIYVYGRPLSREDKENLGEEFLRSMGSFRIVRPPSLLEIKPLGESEWVQDPSMNDVLAFSCPVSVQGSMDVTKYPLGAYVDGEWRVLCIPW